MAINWISIHSGDESIYIWKVKEVRHKRVYTSSFNLHTLLKAGKTKLWRYKSSSWGNVLYLHLCGGYIGNHLRKVHWTYFYDVYTFLFIILQFNILLKTLSIH